LFETCAENYKDRIDSLLFAEDLSDSEVRARAMSINRDMSFWQLWNLTSVIPYFEHIYRVNQSLDHDSKIELYPVDRTFDWSKIETPAQIEQFDETNKFRDSIMAVNTVRYLPGIFDRGEKALIIQNTSHAFLKRPGMYMDYLFKMVDRPVANVFIHSYAWFARDNGPNEPIHIGKWDAAFMSVGEDFGFDFAESPFGRDNFDYVLDVPSEHSYSDIFTGMVYYKPFTEFVWSWGIPDVLNDGFDRELQRRYTMFGNPEELDEIRNMYMKIEIETWQDCIPNFYDYINTVYTK
jgi:hypothetical protein